MLMVISFVGEIIYRVLTHGLMWGKSWFLMYVPAHLKTERLGKH